MTRIVLGTVLSVAIAAAGVLVGAQVPQQFPTAPTPQHPIFRAGATLVAVDAYPTRNGQLVNDLTPGDFEVREDGKPQTIEFFEFLKFPSNPPDSTRQDPETAAEGERLVADPHHRAFVAYFDIYHLYVAASRNMRDPVIEFLNRTIGPTDYFAALNTETPISALTFGQRTETITDNINRYWPVSAFLQAGNGNLPFTAHEKWLQACYGQRLKDVGADDQLLATIFGRWRVDAVLSSLTSLVAKLSSIREERTNVLLFADGWHIVGPDESLLQYSWESPSGRLRAVEAPGAAPRDERACDEELTRLAEMDFSHDFLNLMRDALRANVAFFPIEPDGLAVFDEHMVDQKTPQPWAVVDQDLEPLHEAALNTNGQAIVRTNDIRTPLMALSESFSSYYLLGYYTTNTKLDGKYRTIEVKVKTPGVTVTARHGYEATPVVANAPAAPAAPAVPAADSAALDALTRLDNPEPVSVRATAIPGELTVVAEVSDAEASGIANGADVRVSVKSTGDTAPLTGNGRLAAGTRSALVHVAVGQTTGPWQVTATVSTADGEFSGAASVPKPTAALVSEPLLYRATSSPRSPLWPVAAPIFTRTDRLHLEWALDGPVDNHIARVLDRRGQPLAVGVTLAEPPASTGPSKIVGDVSLAPLAPGDYLIELVVGRGSSSERHLVAFRVGS